MLEQRVSGMSSSDEKFFGRKEGSHWVTNDIGSWPLLKIVADLRKVSTRIPMSFDGSPFVKGNFGPYLHNAAALDHLLTGTGNCLIEVCFF